jgi:hypothetical protein
MGLETGAAMAALLISVIALAVSASILVAYGQAEKRLISQRVRQASVALAAFLLALEHRNPAPPQPPEQPLSQALPRRTP